MSKISKCVIFGGTGFIGANLAQKLSSISGEIIVLTRNPESNKNLKVIPNLKLVSCSLNDDKSIRDNLKNADLVINTVGILNETDQINSFYNIHFQLIEKISLSIKSNSVKRFLHISSLNARVNEMSDYLHTKGLAEQLILSETLKFCNVTIFRPSIVFGEQDSFFNKFAKMLKFIPIFPLACPNARFQPVYVEDLTDFMVECIFDKKTYGEKINVTGPREYSFIELIKKTIGVMKIRRIVIPLNDFLSKIQAHVFQNLPGKLFTIDNFKSLKVDSVSKSGFKGKSTVEDIIPKYLKIKDGGLELRKKAGRK